MTIELYAWGTSNGRKITIALEEMGLDYRVIKVDLKAGNQHEPSFLALSPNGKIPAIQDSETGFTLMESGAILLYLAEKSGRFLPPDPLPRMRTLEWLFWQVASQGPMLGQAHHFLRERRCESEYPEDRYRREANRLYGVLEARLSGTRWLNGHSYSIADMATWPWVCRHEWQEVDLYRDYPATSTWFAEVGARPAVQTGWQAV